MNRRLFLCGLPFVEPLNGKLPLVRSNDWFIKKEDDMMVSIEPILLHTDDDDNPMQGPAFFHNPTSDPSICSIRALLLSSSQNDDKELLCFEIENHWYGIALSSIQKCYFRLQPTFSESRNENETSKVEQQQQPTIACMIWVFSNVSFRIFWLDTRRKSFRSQQDTKSKLLEKLVSQLQPFISKSNPPQPQPQHHFSWYPQHKTVTTTHEKRKNIWKNLHLTTNKTNSNNNNNNNDHHLFKDGSSPSFFDYEEDDPSKRNDSPSSSSHDENNTYNDKHDCSNNNSDDSINAVTSLNASWEHLQQIIIMENPSLPAMRSCVQSLTDSLDFKEPEEDEEDPNENDLRFHYYMSLLFPTTRSSRHHPSSPEPPTTSNVHIWKQGILDCLQQERHHLQNKYKMAFAPTRI